MYKPVKELELVKEQRSSAPELSSPPPTCKSSGAFPQQQSPSPLSFDSRRMVVPPSDRSYHRPYGSPPVYNLGAESAASPTTPVAVEPSAEAASAAEAKEELPLARNLDAAMAEAIAEALLAQQAQQAQAETAQQQLEMQNRALIAETQEPSSPPPSTLGHLDDRRISAQSLRNPVRTGNAQGRLQRACSYKS
jgi:hypothetical protein